MAPCSKCDHPAVTLIRYSGQHLCPGHFTQFVEKRVKREVRRQVSLPREGGVVAVALSGGKDSLVTLHLLHDIYKENPTVRVEAVSVDEGIAGYRPPSLDIAERACADRGITLHTVSYADMTGHPLDDIVDMRPGQSPCATCGPLRRRGLNSKARDIGADVLATGHNLDDTAQSVLMNVLRGDVTGLARLGPHEESPPGLVPRVMPLRAVPEREVALYAHLCGLEVHEGECPHSVGASRLRYRDLLLRLEDEEPGTRHRIVAGYDRLAPALEQALPSEGVRECPRCGEPTSGDGACQTCHLLGDIRAAAAEEKAKAREPVA